MLNSDVTGSSSDIWLQLRRTLVQKEFCSAISRKENK